MVEAGGVVAGKDDELEGGSAVIGSVAAGSDSDAALDESGPNCLSGGFGGIVLVAEVAQKDVSQPLGP